MAPIYFEEQDWFLLFPSPLTSHERGEEIECKVEWGTRRSPTSSYICLLLSVKFMRLMIFGQTSKSDGGENKERKNCFSLAFIRKKLLACFVGPSNFRGLAYTLKFTQEKTKECIN